MPKDSPHSILEELRVGTKNVKDFDLARYYNIQIFKKLDLK